MTLAQKATSRPEQPALVTSWAQTSRLGEVLEIGVNFGWKRGQKGPGS